MKQIITPTAAEGAAVAAKAILTVLRQKPHALLCLAAGHSSLPVFDALLAAAAAGDADFSHARFVGLDEWLGVPSTCEGACGNFMRRSLLTPLNVTEQQLCLFDPLCADAGAECVRIEQYIDHCGGIDFLLLGMGMNGHLALNEPGDSFAQGAHKAPLAQTTLDVAPKYFPLGEMPALSHGVTLGVRNLLAARQIYLTVFGSHKRTALATLLASEESELFPASVLKACAHAVLVADEDANASR